jgi:hypothetical protein
VPGYAAFRKLLNIVECCVTSRLRCLFAMGHGKRHRQTADVPDEPRQFAGDGNRRDVDVFAARGKLSVSPAQPYLSVPSPIDECLRDALVPALDVSAHASRMPVTSGGLDQ